MKSQLEYSKKNNDHASSRSSNNKNRKKISRITISSSLPEEIIDEILYRLPEKSLSRFKCVCKRWLSTISDPGFNVHYKRESNSVFAMSLNCDLRFFSIDDVDDEAAASASASFSSTSVPPLIVKEYNNNPCGRRVITNACNGLVLLRIDKDSLGLFNPSTRCYSVKALTLDCLEPTHDMYYYMITIGLCYDPSIDDYKALLMQSSRSGAPLAYVSCLKTKQWVEIHVPFDDDVPSSTRGPLLNGHMHWIIGTRITYFEATRNTFEVLPSPPDHHQYSVLGFSVLDGCLCIARNRGIRIDEDVQVVAMKKYGVAESWTTLYVLSNMKLNQCLFRLRPLLLTKNREEVLLFLTDWNDIWAYNTANKSYRKFDIPSDYLRATSLVQTIVSPMELVGLSDAK